MKSIPGRPSRPRRLRYCLTAQNTYELRAYTNEPDRAARTRTFMKDQPQLRVSWLREVGAAMPKITFS